MNAKNKSSQKNLIEVEMLFYDKSVHLLVRINRRHYF